MQEKKLQKVEKFSVDIEIFSFTWYNCYIKQKEVRILEYYMENSSAFEFEEACIKKNEQYHCHSRMEIIRVTDGRIRMCLDMAKVVYDVYKGDCVIIKSSDIHRISPGEKLNVEIVRFPLSFCTLVGSCIRSSFIIPAEIISENQTTKNLIDSIFASFKASHKSISSQDQISQTTRSLCYALCSVLLDLYPKRRTTVSISGDRTQNTSPNENVSFETIEKFDTVLSYISDNFCDAKLKLLTLSQVSGINKNYLSFLFPKLTGKHFTSYIHELRINHAIELMCSTEKNISEIALSCGFETIRSFNNVFKCVLGVTPSSFRLSLSGKSEKGIDTVICGTGKDIFSYKWKSNVDMEYLLDECAVLINCRDKTLKLWCHLILRMLFFANKTYRVTYKAKALCNSVGKKATYIRIPCTFQFPDKNTNLVYHHPKMNFHELSDGWYEYTVLYTIPDYYIPSSEDCFSIYSNPTDDLGVSFMVKDIKIERAEE